MFLLDDVIMCMFPWILFCDFLSNLGHWAIMAMRNVHWWSGCSAWIAVQWIIDVGTPCRDVWETSDYTEQDKRYGLSSPSDQSNQMDTWWRHDMEKFSALLIFREDNTPPPLPHKGLVMNILNTFFVVSLLLQTVHRAVQLWVICDASTSVWHNFDCGMY